MCQGEAPQRFAMLSLHCGIVVAEAIKRWFAWVRKALAQGAVVNFPLSCESDSALRINRVEDNAGRHHMGNLNFYQQVALCDGFVERNLQDQPRVQVKN